MNEDKWEEIVENISNKFKVISQETNEDDGKKVDFIIFEGPQGKMKLEYTVKPRTLGVKTLYSKRAGTAASRVESIDSKEETVSFMKAYLWQDDDWKEIKAEDMFA